MENNDNIVGRLLFFFSIVKCVEISETDNFGKIVQSIVLPNKDITAAFIENQPENNHYLTRDAFVLTDNSSYYLISEPIPIHVTTDDKIINDIKEKAKAKLSKGEKELLGL